MMLVACSNAKKCLDLIEGENFKRAVKKDRPLIHYCFKCRVDYKIGVFLNEGDMLRAIIERSEHGE